MYELLNRLLLLCLFLQLGNLLQLLIKLVFIYEVLAEAVEGLKALLFLCSFCDLGQSLSITFLFFGFILRCAFELFQFLKERRCLRVFRIG